MAGELHRALHHAGGDGVRGVLRTAAAGDAQRLAQHPGELHRASVLDIADIEAALHRLIAMVELADPFAGPVEIGRLGGDHQYGAHPVDGLDLDEIGRPPAAGRDQDHAQLARHRRGIGIFDREEGEGFAGHGIDIEGGDEIGHVRGFAARADIHEQVMRGVDEQQAARWQQRLGDGFQVVGRGEMHRDDMDAEARIEADPPVLALQDRGHLGRLIERDDVIAPAARHHGGPCER